MNRKYNFIIPALVAGLLAACGGGVTDKATFGGGVTDKATSNGVPSSWTSVKWGGGGYVTGLVYHPVNSSLLYARTDVGGLYRWNATNSSWIPLTDGLGFGAGEERFHGVESVAFDPTNDQKIYIVTSDTTYWSNPQNGNPYYGRLYTSNDRGTTWSHVDLPFPVGGNDTGRAIGERLALDPTNASTMFYGSKTAGMWKSTDSGQTWAQVTSFSTTTMAGNTRAIGVEHIMMDNSGVGGGGTTWIMYAAVAPDYAAAAGLTSTLYKTTNGGATWTPVTVPSNVTGYYIPHIVRTNDGMFYMTFNKNVGEGPGGPGYLYKFGGTVGNGSWTLLSSSTSGGYAGVSVYGTGSTARVALGVTGTWGTGQITQLSDNGGSTWHEIETGMSGATPGWNDDNVIDPANRDHIMHIHGGGIVETWNASSSTPTWSAKVNNLEETATLSVVTPPAGATYKFINSAGDIGTWVDTDLTTRPTKGPTTAWSSGNAADMAWSNPQYIAGAGVINATSTVFGFSSSDGGNTWTNFASLPAGATSSTGSEGNLAVTSTNNVVWAPPNSVPSYTTNNGASWTATNLPALSSAAPGVNSGYRLAADRRNPNKVYAYDSGGASWTGRTGKLYVSTDGGHTFTLSQGSVAANMAPDMWGNTSMVVNPNAEGDIWVADGSTIYHSTDTGATWVKSPVFATVPGSGTAGQKSGASVIALGKAATGATYSAAVYVLGTINGQWGLWHSDDGGATWARYNDDNHQFGGIQHVAGDWNTYGRIYVNGTGRGLLYTN